MDAAVATAAALGDRALQRRPAGGGYFVYYDALVGRGDHRRPRDRADGDAAGRAHRPRDQRALRLHPELVTSGALWARAPRPPGTRRWTSGAASPCARRCARRRDWPSAASWSTRPSAPRPRTTGAVRGVHHDQRPVPARGAAPPSGRQEPRLGGTTGCSAVRARTPSTRARWPPRSPTPCRSRRPARTPTSVLPATWSPATRRLRGAHPGPDARRLPRLRRLRDGAVVQRRLDGGSRSTSWSADLTGTDPRRPAPLPRGDRARLRGPGEYLGDEAFVDVPSRTCSPTSTPPSGPARSTRTGRRPSRSRRDVDDYDGECASDRVGQRRGGQREHLHHQLTVADGGATSWSTP